MLASRKVETERRMSVFYPQKDKIKSRIKSSRDEIYVTALLFSVTALGKKSISTTLQ